MIYVCKNKCVCVKCVRADFLCIYLCMRLAKPIQKLLKIDEKRIKPRIKQCVRLGLIAVEILKTLVKTLVKTSLKTVCVRIGATAKLLWKSKCLIESYRQLKIKVRVGYGVLGAVGR